MPAKRRSTLSRSAFQRTRMWDAKVKGDIYAAQLADVKPLALTRVTEYQLTHEHLISLVRQTVGRFGIEGSLIHEYMWYAQKLWRLTQTYRDEALKLQADALFLWYLARGRNEAILRSIALQVGIKISDTEVIIERVGIPILLKIIAKDVLLANGTEQTLFEYVGTAVIQGYIDLQNLRDGDEVVITSYVKVKEDGEYKVYLKETYTGKIVPPMLCVLPRLSGVAMKVTLQQTAGIYRSFDYIFIRAQRVA